MESAGEILTAISAQLQRASALSRTIEELGEQFARLRGIGSSENDEATVTVDHHGIVLDVRLSDAALALTGAEIADAVLEAMRRAIADLQEQGEPLRAAVLQPHKPDFDTTLGDRLDALYDTIAGVVDDAGNPRDEEDR